MSSDTFTVNWGGGGGGAGSVSIRLQERAAECGGRGESVLVRGYPSTKDNGRFLQHRFVQS